MLLFAYQLIEMLKFLINLLYPYACAGCGNPLDQSEVTSCITCRHELPYTLHHLNPENEAFKKFYGRLPVVHASSFLYFHKEGVVQELIHNLKYRRREDVGQLLGELYAHDLRTVEALQTVTDIIPVPLHKKKLRQRGYNQVAQFGKALAVGLDATYNDGLLLKDTHTKTQTKKNRAERAAAVETAFSVAFTDADHNKHFLLIDDVITTGATLEACGRTLLRIPGSRVSVVTMAYAH